MSIWVVQSGFFQLSPKVTHTSKEITIRANFMIRILSLFGYDRKVIIYKSKRMVRVRQTSWWFPKIKTFFSYDLIKQISMERKALANEFNWLSSIFGRYDELEFWRVYLELDDTKIPRIHLVTFRGEGSAATGFSGWFFGGDSAIDFHGDQEKKAKEFAGMLSEVLKKPVKNRQNEFYADKGGRYGINPWKRH